MGLYSVLEYVKEQVDGTAVPSRAAAVAYLNPPVSGDADVGTLQLFVWSGDLNEARQTAPRMTGGNPSTGAFKKLIHDVSIYALMVDDPSDARAGRAFFQGIDAVMARLRAIDLPVAITDPDTTIASEIVLIGEKFKVRTDAVRATAAARYVRYLAQITTEAVEILQS